MKNKYILTTILFIYIFSFSSYILGSAPRVQDSANLLSSDEITKLEASLDDFYNTYNMEAVILTTNDIGSKSPRSYALDYFHSKNYGYNNSNDGVILMIDMGTRTFNISSSGKTIDYLSDIRLDSIKANITPHLSSGDYYKACTNFIKETSHYIDSGVAKNNSLTLTNGKKLFTNDYNQPLTPLDYLKCAGVAALSAGLISFITRHLIYNSYVNPKHVTPLAFPNSNSVDYNEKKDVFVSTHTSKHKIESSKNSSSGHGGSGSTTGSF